MATTIPAGARVAKRRKTITDMMWSLGVLLLAFLPFVALWAILTPEQKTPVPVVDPAAAIARAQAEAPFEVVAPREAPYGWIATSAAYDGVADGVPPRLRVGYLTETGEFVGYSQQTNAGSQPVVEDVVGGSEAVDSRTVAGVLWEVYPTSRGEAAWVHSRPDSLIVVVGSATDAELAALAGKIP